MLESFTSLAPAEQRAKLRPAEAFPVTNVVYSETDRVLLLTAQHFKTSTVGHEQPAPRGLETGRGRPLGSPFNGARGAPEQQRASGGTSRRWIER